MNIIETNFNYGKMDKRSKTTRIILHHTATTNETPEQIHDYHKNTQKYAGAGYHFYVRKNGEIYRLRPEEYVGAHAYGSNYDSIGICAEGNYNEETMPEAQVMSLKEIVAYIKGKYNINNVQKHKDVCATSCPGNNYLFDEIVKGIIEVKPVVDERKERIKELQTLLNRLYIRKDEKQLDVDGIIGEKTEKILRRVALKNYTANALVAFVQRRLIMNGRGVGNCGADGKYGKATADAVRKFQQAKGLTVDGIAGINTIKALL